MIGLWLLKKRLENVPSVPELGGLPDVSSTPPSDTSPPAPAPSGMLNKQGVIQYVRQNASRFGVDGGAMLAVAGQEGLNTEPGSYWQLPGERYRSFGPPSWYGGGAGAAILAAHGEDASRWSWSAEGLDYWIQQVANSGARGLTGASAIRAIVVGFERPRADLVEGEIARAIRNYEA